MAKFMFIYRAEPWKEEPSPEQMQEIMGKWMAWIDEGMNRDGW